MSTRPLIVFISTFFKRFNQKKKSHIIWYLVSVFIPHVLSYTSRKMQNFLAFRDSPIIPLRRSPFKINLLLGEYVISPAFLLFSLHVCQGHEKSPLSTTSFLLFFLSFFLFLGHSLSLISQWAVHSRLSRLRKFSLPPVLRKAGPPSYLIFQSLRRRWSDLQRPLCP